MLEVLVEFRFLGFKLISGNFAHGNLFAKPDHAFVTFRLFPLRNYSVFAHRFERNKSMGDFGYFIPHHIHFHNGSGDCRAHQEQNDCHCSQYFGADFEISHVLMTWMCFCGLICRLVAYLTAVSDIAVSASLLSFI